MKIMRINLKLRVKLFKNWDVCVLLLHIIRRFVDYAEENNFKPILLIIPQKDDIEYGNYYWEIFKMSLVPNFIIIDMFNIFKKQNDIYSDDNRYGGHPNKKANELIAKEVLKYVS